ncbi:MAG: pyridoxal phosphate-dependent aminotransferase [Parvularculaceae bacterium]
MKAIPEALSIYINQIVYDQRRMKRDVVALSLGEAFFDIPMMDFGKIDPDKGYHYSDSRGIPELRAKVAQYYDKYYGAKIDAEDEILISAGSKPIIFMCMAALVDPGQEVLIHEPAWVSYQEHIRLVGASPKFIPYDAPIETFSDYINENTRLVIVNNPNNPAGRLYAQDELQSIYDQASVVGAYVMVDEAYSDFVIDDRFVSMARVVPNKKGTLTVNSLSKNMGMSGWRIGYLIAHPDVIDQVLKVNQHLITCAPSILQHYMARYFDDIIDITLPQVRDVVEKRQRIAGVMDDLGLERLDGGCTFYFFVSIGNFPASSLDFALKLLVDDGIAVVPGSAYGASTERFVRISIGTESEERIYKSLQRIRDLIGVNAFDVASLHERMAAAGVKHFEPGGDAAQN